MYVIRNALGRISWKNDNMSEHEEIKAKESPWHRKEKARDNSWFSLESNLTESVVSYNICSRALTQVITSAISPTQHIFKEKEVLNSSTNIMFSLFSFPFGAFVTSVTPLVCDQKITGTILHD